MNTSIISTVTNKITVSKILLCLLTLSIKNYTIAQSVLTRPVQSKQELSRAGASSKITIITNATVTSYCACKTCCGPNAKGITANGRAPIQGITIAAPRSIPFGSRVTSSGIPQTVSSSQTLVVQDRLAQRYDSRFDIYFAKHSDAKKFGIKHNQTVTIITTTK